MIPKDLPPRSTLYGNFAQWEWDGRLERIDHAIDVKCLEQAEREASPTAAIIDSQSVKSADLGRAKRTKGGGRLIRTVMTPARRLRARSAIFL